MGISIWEGLHGLPPLDGYRFWLRFTMEPLGRPRTGQLSLDIVRKMDVPVHAVGRRVLDMRAERCLEMSWNVSGLALAWEEDHSLRTSKEDIRRSLDTAVRVLEALTSITGGSGFTVRWIRSSLKKERMVSCHLASRGAGWFPWPMIHTTVLSNAEAASWLPPPSFDSFHTIEPHSQDAGGSLNLGVDRRGGALSIPWSEAEGHHMLVAGETGMGKSTLLVLLAAQALNDDACLILVDPLGDTASDLLAQIGEDHLQRTILVAPESSPVEQNLLAIPDGPRTGPDDTRLERRVGELVTSLRRVRAERFGDTFYWGPRIEDVLTRVFLILASFREPNLKDAEDLLTDPSGVHLPFIEDPAASQLVKELLEGLKQEKPADLEGARRVIKDVTLSPSMMKVLSSRRPRWDVSMALDPGAITLISTERPLVGQRASSFLASMMLTLLWSRIVARGRGRNKVILLLDEVQEYANESLLDMLRQGRRFNLHVWAATQSLAAIPRELKDGLVTNSRDIVLFRGSPGDSAMARDDLYLPEDENLMTLGRGEAIAFLNKSRKLARFSIPPFRMSPAERCILGEERMKQVVEHSMRFWGARPAEQPGVPLHENMEKGEVPSASDPIYALLFGAMSLEPGEDLVVPLSRVEKLVRGDVGSLRSLGSVLKGRGALIRSERREGGKYWILSRVALEGAIETPISPQKMKLGREEWERSGAS